MDNSHSWMNRQGLKTVLKLLSLVLLAGCGAASKPIMFVEPPPVPLSITTIPVAMVPRTPFKIMCQLPTDFKEEGTYTFGIVDMFTDAGPIDKLQYSEVINGQCEPIRIICGYTPAGASKPIMIYKDIEPIGDCGVSQH